MCGLHLNKRVKKKKKKPSRQRSKQLIIDSLLCSHPQVKVLLLPDLTFLFESNHQFVCGNCYLAFRQFHRLYMEPPGYFFILKNLSVTQTKSSSIPFQLPQWEIWKLFLTHSLLHLEMSSSLGWLQYTEITPNDTASVCHHWLLQLFVNWYPYLWPCPSQIYLVQCY